MDDTAMATTTTTVTETSTTAAAPPADDKKPSTVEWVLWRHRCPIRVAEEEEWKDDMKEQAHFFACPTKQDFHMNLNILPLPSKTFFLKTTINNETGQHMAPLSVDDGKHTEYSLFQKGIKPEWEDIHNIGEYSVKHYFPPELLDKYWLQLSHGIMEGKINDQYVNGIRVVDKSKGKHPIYKLEIWLNTNDITIRNNIRKQAMDCIEPLDEHYKFNFHWREFHTTTTNANNTSEEMTTASETSVGG